MAHHNVIDLRPCQTTKSFAKYLRHTIRLEGGGRGVLVRYIFSYCRVWRKVPEKVCVLANTYVNRMARFKSVPSDTVLAVSRMVQERDAGSVGGWLTGLEPAHYFFFLLGLF